MSHYELYLSARPAFTGVSSSLETSRSVCFGVPFDRTSTYKPGSRFAPSALRDVSANLELYSIRSNLDLERTQANDAGDIHTVEDLNETLRRITAVWRELADAGKIPIMAGGEHTVTKAAIDALPTDIGLVNLDAHLDLRDEFLGEKLSHATFMRRVAEQIGPSHIMEVGIRAFSKPELDYCHDSGLQIITPLDIRKTPLDKTAQRIRSFLSGFTQSYLTVDIDVLDPAYAPGVGNPEPDGITTDELLTLVQAAMNRNTRGFDLVEVSPQLDCGQTAAVGAKVIFEAIAALSSRSPTK